MAKDMPDTRPAHSPLGASGAERWMNCPGSVALLRDLTLPESDDPSYRAEGTAMHECADRCLREELDTWEVTGETFNGVVVDAPMALFVQQYLDHVRPYMRDARTHYVEAKLSAPVHPDFYGTVDFGAVMADRVIVRDLKGGKGIVVEPDHNPQLMYYAFALIYWIEAEWTHCLPGDMIVDLGIVQPRAWHPDGPIRAWETTVGAIKEWVHDTLVPAMLATEYDNTLDAGPWCRFCPAKLVCPLLTSLFGAAARANPAQVVNLNDQSIGRSYQYLQAVEFYMKALREETLRRLLSAHTVPGAKLVNKKANRVWNPEAIELAKEKFGEEAFTRPEIKGPAAIDKLGPTGAEFVRQYAYTPNTGYTVALESDKRAGVQVQKAAEVFGDLAAALRASAEA